MSDTIVLKKDGAVFKCYEDLSHINDSLQFDSGTLICEYISADEKYKVEIEVIGEVSIRYSPSGFVKENDDEDFDTPSDFNDDMKEMLKNGGFWTSKKIEINNNNWFELTYRDNEDGSYLDSDVCEAAPGCDPESLMDLCADSLKEYLEYVGE